MSGIRPRGRPRKDEPRPRTTANGKPVGRPPKELELDEKQIQRLAALQCSLPEIAAVAGCSVDTLERRFADAIEKGRLEGKVSLKRTQFIVATGYSYERAGSGEVYTREPNPTMLIWLGKIVLGQKETVRQQIVDDDAQPRPLDERVGEIADIINLARERARRAAPPRSEADIAREGP